MAVGGRARFALRAVVLALAAAIPILACGRGSIVPENIPRSTLAPTVGGLRVAILDGSTVYLRDGATGATMWQRAVWQQELAGQRLQPALAAVGGLLYATSQAGPMVAALRPSDGTVVWSLGSCAGYDDTLYRGAQLFYVTCGSQGPATAENVTRDVVDALDPQTGRIVWSLRGAHVRAVRAGLVVVQTSTGLQGLDAQTGATRWTHAAFIADELASLYASPTAAAEASLDAFAVRVGTTDTALFYSPDGQTVEALDLTDGHTLWHSGPVQDPFTEIGPAPLRNAEVLMVSPSTIITHSGYGVTALNAADGTVRWRYYNYFAGAVPAIADADGTTYVLSLARRTDTTATLTAFAPDNGTVRWRILASTDRQALLALGGGMVLVEGSNALLAYRAVDGVLAWDDKNIQPGAITANADVVCVQSGATIYLLKLADGTKVWKVLAPTEGAVPTQIEMGLALLPA